MSKSLIRKNQLHPDITDLVGQYGSGYFVSSTSNQTIAGLKTFSNGIISNAGITGNASIIAPNLVYNTGDQTIAGLKTFSNGIISNAGITGNASIIAPNLVYNTGDQNISGQKTFVSPVIFGTGTSTGIIISGSYVEMMSSPIITGGLIQDEVRLHTRARSTRPILNQIDYDGSWFAYQPGLLEKTNIYWLYPRPDNSTTPTNFPSYGVYTTIDTTSDNTLRGSATVLTDSYFSSTRRWRLVGRSTGDSQLAASFAHTASATQEHTWFRGQQNYGGFYYKSRFGIGGNYPSSITGRTRAFMGLSSLFRIPLTISGTIASKTGVAMLGIGYESGAGTWCFIHNSGGSGSTPTIVPLSNAYTNTQTSGNIIEFVMYATPYSGVGFHANIDNSGALFATGYYTNTNLPSRTELLGINHGGWVPNNAGTGNFELHINGVYIESFT